MKFADLTAEQIKFIETVNIDMPFVTQEQAKEIRKILDLNFIKGEEEIRAIRNAVVKHLGTKAEFLLEHEDVKSSMKLMTTMSGITAVIDDVIWKMGCEV